MNVNIKPRFERISYGALNSRQKEGFNFQKVSAVLADYGFTTIRLTSDWQGADFIAQHFDGKTFLKVQLKGRCTFDKKYLDRDIHICFPSGDRWFLYPHDELFATVLAGTGVGKTASWENRGVYHFPYVTPQLAELLEPYCLEVGEARSLDSVEDEREE